jgi:hypothetical protein
VPINLENLTMTYAFLQDPKWLDSRIESFLNMFRDDLQKITAEEFKVRQFVLVFN